ncbi:uncharacterized protein [Littorina saxatilis]|uniref:uncharacterized protein n=1 Tax=Littorina saxatilis TaxID=31220 RepID=UPI0038B55DD8
MKQTHLHPTEGEGGGEEGEGEEEVVSLKNKIRHVPQVTKEEETGGEEGGEEDEGRQHSSGALQVAGGEVVEGGGMWPASPLRSSTGITCRLRSNSWILHNCDNWPSTWLLHNQVLFLTCLPISRLCQHLHHHQTMQPGRTGVCADIVGTCPHLQNGSAASAALSAYQECLR